MSAMGHKATRAPQHGNSSLSGGPSQQVLSRADVSSDRKRGSSLALKFGHPYGPKCFPRVAGFESHCDLSRG